MGEEEVKYETEKLHRFPPKLKTLKEFHTTEFITFNTDKHTVLEQMETPSIICSTWC